MTILFVNSIGRKKWGGGEKWMLQTAIGLNNRGHDITIACRKKSVLARKAIRANVKVFYITNFTDFSFYSTFKFFRFIRKNKTAVVLCSLNRDVRIVGSAAKLCKNKVVVIGRQGVQLIKKKWKYKFTFKFLTDGILTNSNSLKQIYDSYKWWNNSFVKVIYNGIDIHQLDEEKPFDYSRFFTKQEIPLIILSAGRLAKQKGFEYLIQAASRAENEGKNWLFFIAGKGNLEDHLRHKIHHYQLEKMVFVLNDEDTIIPLLKGADLFVLPSLFEGTPNVLLEAMKVGVPVITTPVNGSKEIVKNNITGRYINTKDGDSIFRTIIKACSSIEETKKMANEAKKYVDNNFFLEQSVINVESYLLEMVKKKSRNFMKN